MPEEPTIKSNAITRALNPISTNSTEIPATKQFAVNATGNLFIATTLNGGDSQGSTISSEAEDAFGQVSVFFAALTKAMAEEDKSLYNYEAINNVVSKSGLFVKVTQSLTNFESKKFGMAFSNELIQTLFGLSGSLASIGKSLTDMIVGIGKEAQTINVDVNSTDEQKKVGTIIFVCEYLLGAVSITPIVLSIDYEEVKKAVKVGPCFNLDTEKVTLNIQKTVYLFVPPSFTKHAAELNEAMSDPEFINLVDSLREVINPGTEASTAPPATPNDDE